MRFGKALLLAALSGSPVACSRPGVLVAESGHHRMIARDQNTGITMIVTTGAWEGRPEDFDRHATVLHVLVANMGNESVLLAPGDLELRDLRGFRYALLDAGASFYRVSDDADPGAPYGRSVRPSYDYGSEHAFKLMHAPEDVGKYALPWGVLEPGTQMRGYLYFEEVTTSANGARLVWHLQTPDHRPLVDLAFDFYVVRP